MTLFAFWFTPIINTEFENERESIVIRCDPSGDHFMIVEMKSGGGIGRTEIRTDDGVAEKCVGVVEMVEKENGAWGGA